MRKRRHWTTVQIMIPGFAALILLGGLILMLPICNKDGQWLNFVDALFTACTCVCVTGLVTIVPAVQFTIFGKFILLLLIQIGGLGILVSTMYLMVILKMKLSINARVLLQNRFGMDSLGGMVRMLIFVVQGTLIAELIGALGYSIRFIPQYGFIKGLCFSIFHSVSAFCNAGVDILGDTSLQNYGADPWFLLITALLIISGGLGFMVWRDLGKFFHRLLKDKTGFRTAVRKLRLHTKIVLTTTFVLLILGMIFYLAVEWNNAKTLGTLPVWEKCLAAFFQSVTTRTAGFYTISQNGLTQASKFVSCIFMFIGGSPIGTAGGIKTVTLAVIILTCWSILKGHPDTECYHRKIAAETVRTAILVAFAGLGMVLLGTVMLSLWQPELNLINVLFEVTSSVATVGLTADVTPYLGIPGKCVIIMLMYIGRIGPVTIPLLIASKLGKNGKCILPEEHVIVG